MLGNYIKIAFRRLKFFKTYSVISIAGLAVGLASCFIIFLYISYQLSFDKYNRNIDNIFLIYFNDLYAKISMPTTPLILGPTLKAEFPEVDQYARWRKRTCTIKFNEMEFKEENCVFADPSIFNILTLPLAAGSLSAFSSEFNSIILSETSAYKYFNKQNPIGEILQVNFNGTDYLLKVTAVIKDIPKTSTFAADFILPLSIFEKYRTQERAKLPANMFTLWDFPEVYTYLLLSPNCNIKEFQNKLTEFSKRPEHMAGGNQVNYSLFSLEDIYFYSSFMINNEFPQGDISNVYIYSGVAFLNLLISIITYLMLSIGKSSFLIKDIAVRKTVGAGKKDLLIQSIIESSITTLLALPLSIILVELFLPVISQLIGQKIFSSYYHNWSYLIVFWSVALLLGIISGSYLSFYFSKFNPIEILKNKITTGSNRATFRKIMLSIQMIVFMSLVFASVVIYKQLHFLLDKDFGFVKEGLVVFYPEDKEIGKRFDVFKNEIKKHPDIIDVSCGNILPGSNATMLIEIPRKESYTNSVRAEMLFVDKDFIETMKIKMRLGLSFQQRKITDSSNVCIINETAMKEFGFANPVGEKLMNMEIIGVVKDFNIHSLHNKIIPVVIVPDTKKLNEIVIRIRDETNKLNVINFVREKSIEFNNNKPMEFRFYDERLGELYIEEKNFGKIIAVFTIVAIFLSCIGLYGMSLFVFSQRTKEIGIRKVLGATMPNLLYVITKEILLTALISALISFPVSYLFINQWLQNFAYKVSLNFWIYLISLLIMMMLIALSISYQAIKIAIANPNRYLKYE